ncbi:MAG: sulfite reductase subunit alpha, partial [Janthinobacterium lividum]
MIAAGEQFRWCCAGGLVMAYVAMCGAIFLAQLRKQRLATAGQAMAGDRSAWIIAWASQTGNAEDLAAQTAATFHLAGISARSCALDTLTAQQLSSAKRVLFVVSTYGEGDPPDNAALFASRVMSAPLPLPDLHFGVLALGDRSYRNFCGFGMALHAWLAGQGAAPLFARIDVDRGQPEAIDAWRAQLLHQAGTSDLPDWDGPPFASWTLAARRVLNPGSAGEAVFHLELEPADGMLPAWESGDLVQVMAPADPARAREYSIASIPAEGRIHLLVRLQRHEDGSTGIASGWLGQQAAIGAAVTLRLRSHRRFHLQGNGQRPLILIGNGTGIAGLRSHLKSRQDSGASRNWLIFGERNAAHDHHYRDEIDAWLAQGTLQHADLVFSRDQPQRRYVQDCLRERAVRLRAWVDEGAAIYVCGSLKGMAAGV